MAIFAASAAILYILNYANQLETLAIRLNESVYNNEISLVVDGVGYYPDTDTLSFVGDVDCQQGQRVEMFGCGNLIVRNPATFAFTPKFKVTEFRKLSLYSMSIFALLSFTCTSA